MFVRKREGRPARVGGLAPETVQAWMDHMAETDLALSTMRSRQPASSSPRRSATVSARTRPNSASNAPKSSSRGSPRAAREAADDANTGSSSSRIPRSRGRIVSRSPASRWSRISVKHHSPSSGRLASWAPLRPRARSPMPPGVAPRVAKISPSFGPIWVKSLGGSGIGSLALSNGDGLLADVNGGVPRDPDRVLHALVRGAALRMDFERAPGRLAGLPRHPEIVVDVDGFDPDGLADARDPTVDSGGESLAVEGDLAPCQGATQGAVHSTRDGGDDVVERRRDRRPFLGAVVLTERSLDSVDHRLGHLAEVRVPVALAVLKAGVRNVLEVEIGRAHV